MNQPITIGDVPVSNADVVFGDEDGVVVIPCQMWPQIEAAAFDVIANEARIRLSAARGLDVHEILARFGSL